MIFILFFSKNRQSVFTKLPVLFFLLGKNLDSCDSGLSCSLSYCFCHSFCDSLIEGIRDDVVSGDLVIRDQICDGVGSSHFHLVIDIRCAYIQSSAENTREPRFSTEVNSGGTHWGSPGVMAISIRGGTAMPGQ